jgi:hypothetical protein
MNAMATFARKSQKSSVKKKNIPDEFNCKDKNFEPSHPP